MSFLKVLRSKPGRALVMVCGAWLLIAGVQLTTLGGLVMMMGGIVLIVVPIAGVGLANGSR